jgi:hypothetical protein
MTYLVKSLLQILQTKGFSHVYLRICLIKWLFLLNTADEKLFSGMGSEMYSKVAFPVKSFITYIAGEWLFSSMGSEMHI